MSKIAFINTETNGLHKQDIIISKIYYIKYEIQKFVKNIKIYLNLLN